PRRMAFARARQHATARGRSAHAAQRLRRRRQPFRLLRPSSRYAGNPSIAPQGAHMIHFETTLGRFTVELHEKEAPVTVANFLKYIDEGFFDGTTFHRIVPGFVIQGGGFTADMSQKRTHPT